MAVYAILNEWQDINSRGTFDPFLRLAQHDHSKEEKFCHRLLYFENMTLPLYRFTFEISSSPYRLA
jgi:hypothetical protein